MMTPSITPNRFFSGLAFSFLTSVLLSTTALAQGGPIDMSDESPEASPAPVRSSPTGAPMVGRKAAQKYMGPHEAPATERGSSRFSADDHYLAVHFGGYVSDNAYRWGTKDNQSDIGDATLGVTYRLGEWQRSMDLAIRIDYSAYGLEDGTAGKLSFLPVITFPDASSRFPLYLGAGLGLGVFTKQVNRESALSFDYQLVLGARFFEVIGNTGFFVEAGVKNHLLLLSDGQFNGTFVAAGPVFTF